MFFVRGTEIIRFRHLEFRFGKIDNMMCKRHESLQNCPPLIPEEDNKKSACGKLHSENYLNYPK